MGFGNDKIKNVYEGRNTDFVADEVEEVGRCVRHIVRREIARKTQRSEQRF
jgi:hypothetical protein